jgi:PEP-CTERM motif
MKLERAFLFLLVGILLVSIVASAAEITFTEQAIISGTLNQVAFTNQPITILFTTDTSLVYLRGIDWYAIDASPQHLAYLMIGNLPQYYFTDPVRVDVDQTHGWGGFHDSNPEGGLMVTFNDAFTSYSLQSSLGPVTGPGQVNTELTFGTSGGGLVITDFGETTFTARMTAIPEPSSLLLVGSGVLGVLRVVRRRMAH